MSPRNSKFYLEDIVEAIAKIQGYAANMTIDQLESDEKTLDAVERNFIIIGEASANIPDDIQEQFSSVPWRLMQDMRNFAVHVYWGVSVAVLWKTIQDDLPPLSAQLEDIISKTE